jgi:hypothetical protein
LKSQLITRLHLWFAENGWELQAETNKKTSNGIGWSLSQKYRSVTGSFSGPGYLLLAMWAPAGFPPCGKVGMVAEAFAVVGHHHRSLVGYIEQILLKARSSLLWSYWAPIGSYSEL